MNLLRFARNVLFALILFLVAALAAWAELPAAERLEEYIAFVLTTDLDVQPLIDMGHRLWLSAGGLNPGARFGPRAEPQAAPQAQTAAPAQPVR